jgi:hypothetical protein
MALPDSLAEAPESDLIEALMAHHERPIYTFHW